MPIYNTYWEIHRKIIPVKQTDLTTHSLLKCYVWINISLEKKTLNLGKNTDCKLALICRIWNMDLKPPRISQRVAHKTDYRGWRALSVLTDNLAVNEVIFPTFNVTRDFPIVPDLPLTV
jgi:hypothetical protein